MKIFIILCVFFFLLSPAYSQSDIDQNGWKSSVTNTLYANDLQAMRYEIANIGYNSFHWQSGGLIVIELFHQNFATGYEKYILENGYGQGVNHGTPSIKLVERQGAYHLAKISVGAPYELSSADGGYPNKGLPVYLDVKYYAGYKVKLTYLQNKVNELGYADQIKVNVAPLGIPIDDFSIPEYLENNLSSSGRLMVVGTGNHYIKNGNVGIGTDQPDSKLAVNGNIRAKEIKVDNGNWPDYVFRKYYPLLTPKEIERYIKEKGHLPGIPSAEEVKIKGIELGEMSGKLLQKIEEITLYLIEQDKKIEILEKKNLNQQAEIDRLKSKSK